MPFPKMWIITSSGPFVLPWEIIYNNENRVVSLQRVVGEGWLKFTAKDAENAKKSKGTGKNLASFALLAV
jgi:hypothetical protein